MGLIFDYVYEVGVLLATLVIGVVVYLKWKQGFWQRKGVSCAKTSLPFGSIKNIILGKRGIGEQFQDMYNDLKEQKLAYGGVYMFWRPVFLPVDPEFLKNIMVKDFQHFVNHGGYTNIDVDPLNCNLFNISDAEWRNLRVKLTPTFTSGKMKMMFNTLTDCAGSLKDVMDEYVSNEEPVDIKDILARFTTDIIGSCAFGLEINSLKDPKNEFRKYGKLNFDIGPMDKLKIFALFLFTNDFLKKIRFRLTKIEVEEFFMKVVKDIVDYREKNKVYRKDFMHLLLQLKNRGEVEDDEKMTGDIGESAEKGLTMKELAAQAFVFFIGGFETSSTTMAWALYELALNPKIQARLRKEINTVLDKHDGKLTYEAMMEMTYMDKVIFETLRKYPPLAVLPRLCSQDYIIPETSICLEKDTAVMIPILGIHKDPEYYPEPEMFDPERFSEEEKSKRHPFTWIPFGEGPRVCIGQRFAMMQSKVGLATLLNHYELTLDAKTKVPLDLDKGAFVTTPATGIWLDVQKAY